MKKAEEEGEKMKGVEIMNIVPWVLAAHIYEKATK